MHNFWQNLGLTRRDRTLVLVAVAIYVLSCLLPAGRTPGAASGDRQNTYRGGVLLLNGLTWICGCLPLSSVESLYKGHGEKVGPLFTFTLINWSPWLANPLFCCGVWQLWLGRRARAVALAGAAFVLAGLFLGSEFMKEQSIREYPAYYVWVAAQAVLAGSCLIPRTKEKEGQTTGGTERPPRDG